MPKQTITSAQNRALSNGFLDLMGESKSKYKTVNLTTIASSLAYCAAVYTDMLKKELIKKDADSSGSLSDSIYATEVKMFGSIYSVEISANKYAAFVDEGVDGWNKSRGSRFKFKTKGVNPNSDMVKSIKAWLLREGNISRIKNRPISSREGRRAKITDATTRAAVTASYMIKREGIAPTHFWSTATSRMDEVLRKEFAAALRVDIVQNLTG